MNLLVNFNFTGTDPEECSVRRNKETSGKHRDSCNAKRIFFGDTTTDKSLHTELQDNMVVSSRHAPLPHDELSDVDVGFAMDKLQKQFGNTTAGLQYPGLGQFLPSKSLPRFRKSNDLPFVQIINVQCRRPLDMRDECLWQNTWGCVHLR